MKLKQEIMTYLAMEGMDVAGLDKFEKFFDAELQGSAALEIHKQMKEQLEKDNENTIDIVAIAQEARIRF